MRSLGVHSHLLVRNRADARPRAFRLVLAELARLIVALVADDLCRHFATEDAGIELLELAVFHHLPPHSV